MSDISAESDIARHFLLFNDTVGNKKEVVVKQIDKLENLIKNNENFQHPKELIDIFKNHKREINLPNGKKINKAPHLLIAGGFIRDILTGHEPRDIDFATELSGDEVENLLKKHYKIDQEKDRITLDDGTTIVLKKTGKEFPIIRIYFRKDGRDEEYEIATFRGPNKKAQTEQEPEDDKNTVRIPGLDAEARDLTCNALFYNPLSGRIFDYVGGLKDIQDKKLKFTSDPKKIITEDATRSLRYVRFLLKTGFSEDDNSISAIKDNLSEVKKLAGDKIMLELIKLSKENKRGLVLKKLNEFGLLKEIMPEVEALKDTLNAENNDVLSHTEKVLDNLPKESSFELVISTYIHDIGKKETRKEFIDENGVKKISFEGFEKKSKEKAPTILRRLRFPVESIDKVKWLIENHTKVIDLHKMEEYDARELIKNNNFDDLLSLAIAEDNSSEANQEIKNESIDRMNKSIDRIKKIRNFLSENKEVLEDIEKLVSKEANDTIIEKINVQFKEKNLGEFSLAQNGKLMGQIKDKFRREIANRMIIDTEKSKLLLDDIIKELA